MGRLIRVLAQSSLHSWQVIEGNLKAEFTFYQIGGIRRDLAGDLRLSVGQRDFEPLQLGRLIHAS